MRIFPPSCAWLLLSPITAASAAPMDAIGGGKITETLIGLSVVLLLIFALARVLQKLTGSSQGSDHAMRIVGSMSLGAKEKVLLLHVEDKHILVGVTPQAISSLHVFDEEVAIYDAAQEPRHPGKNFGAVLQSLGAGYSK
jgi:flagellar protein FliO/FliZ